MTCNIAKNYRFRDEIKRQSATVDFASHLERGLGVQKFRGGPHRICAKWIGRCDVSLMGVIHDGELQIHMAIRGELRSQEESMGEEGEMPHIGYFREIIGLIAEGLIVLLAMKWMAKKIMMIISMEIGIVLIANGAIRKARWALQRMVTIIPQVG